jgi:hypothetical protein
MNKIKKLAGAIMLTITVSTLGISVQPLDVAAETLTYMTKKPTTCTFDSAWERTRQIYEYDSSAIVGTLCYGYDTVLISVC